MSINILPWREMAQQKKQARIIYRLIIYSVILMMMLLPTKLFITHQLSYFSKKSHRINTAIQAIVLQDSQKNNAHLLNQLKLVFPIQLASMKNNRAMMMMLLEISTDLPSTLIFTQLTVTKKAIDIRGTGSQLTDIQQYDAELQKTNWQHIVLSDVHNDTKNQIQRAQIDFSIRMAP